MQVILMTRNPEAGAMRADVERRVRFVFRRMSWRLPRAAVRFTDINGPRGGIDKHCQIELHTDGAGQVVISAVGTTWRAALDEALARAARFLQRLWQRLRVGRRQADEATAA